MSSDTLLPLNPMECGLFRYGDVEAASEVAERLAGGVAEIVAANRFHDDLHRIEGMLGHQVGEGMPAAVAAPPRLT